MVRRRSRAQDEGRDSGDHGPDVLLVPVPVRRVLVRRAQRALQPEREEALVAQVCHRVEHLGQHRGRAGGGPASELGCEHAEVAHDGRAHRPAAHHHHAAPRTHGSKQAERRRLQPAYPALARRMPLPPSRVQRSCRAPTRERAVLHVKDHEELGESRRAVHIVLGHVRQPLQVVRPQHVLVHGLSHRQRLPLLRRAKLLVANRLPLFPPRRRAYVRRDTPSLVPSRRRAQRSHRWRRRVLQQPRRRVRHRGRPGDVPAAPAPGVSHLCSEGGQGRSRSAAPVPARGEHTAQHALWVFVFLKLGSDLHPREGQKDKNALRGTIVARGASNSGRAAACLVGKSKGKRQDGKSLRDCRS